jgi:hypothetical protein
MGLASQGLFYGEHLRPRWMIIGIDFIEECINQLLEFDLDFRLG